LGQRLSGAWPVANSLESHIRAEQVRIVFRQAPPVQLLSIVAAGAVCWALWGLSDHARLVTWLGVIAAVTLVRIALAAAFALRRPAPDTMVWWERAFVGSITAVTLAWGIGGWLIMPADSPVHQALVYFFLMGVAGGTVATYSAHAVAAAIAVCALMLPATVAFALQDALVLRIMAAGGLLYLAAALRSMRGFGFFLRRTLQLSYELQQAYARVREQAHTDELTGLANRRAFVEIGTASSDQARRYHRPLALLLIDVDHFKRINDTYGHAVGDAALRAAAGALRQAARRADTAGRLGGEEFALLLPETTLTQAVVVAERIRRDVAAITVPHGNTPIRFTCSIGVAEQTPAVNDLDALLRSADEAMYEAKAQGRDRVAVGSDADSR
jgi:diguanylate cyclase (GGDEF)-like protein